MPSSRVTASSTVAMASIASRKAESFVFVVIVASHTGRSRQIAIREICASAVHRISPAIGFMPAV